MTRNSIAPVARFLGFAIIFSSLASCVSRVPVSQAFWQDKKARVAVAVMIGEGQGRFSKEGNQGLLDIAISNAMTTGPTKALANVKPDTFRKVKGDFAGELKKRGFNAVEVKNDLQFQYYPELAGGDGGDPGRDYSTILSAYKADYLIVLSLDNYGAIRPYYGPVPLSAPSGYASASGFMVKNGATKPLWMTGNPGNRSHSPVQGEWDQKPNYKNLTEAAVQAIDNSRGNLVADFFE